MRPHHFVFILVCIATYLLLFDSALSLSRFKAQPENKPDPVLTTLWGGGS